METKNTDDSDNEVDTRQSISVYLMLYKTIKNYHRGFQLTFNFLSNDEELEIKNNLIDLEIRYHDLNHLVADPSKLVVLAVN